MSDKTKAQRREARKKNRKYAIHSKSLGQIYAQEIKKRAEKAKSHTG